MKQLFFIGQIYEDECPPNLVSWSYSFTGTNPPTVVPLGRNVLVYQKLLSDQTSLEPIDTGILTLTPSINGVSFQSLILEIV